jgi:hypothetical protein
MLEQPGIYVHPDLVSEVRLHAGAFVLEFAQASTTVNCSPITPFPDCAVSRLRSML